MSSNEPRILLISGPPGAGKDSVTQELEKSGIGFCLFDKLKVGSGTSSGYRMTTAQHLQDLKKAGDLVQVHSRYGNTYAVDKSHIEAMSEAGQVPVIHVGRRRNFAALSSIQLPSVSVLLWVSLQESERRVAGRTGELFGSRSQAWVEERDELLAHPLQDDFDAAYDSSFMTPEQIASRIVSSWPDLTDGESLKALEETLRGGG